MKTIDEKCEVMKASDDGRPIVQRMISNPSGQKITCIDPSFNWGINDYWIAEDERVSAFETFCNAVSAVHIVDVDEAKEFWNGCADACMKAVEDKGQTVAAGIIEELRED